MTLAPDFGCDYGSEIIISTGTNVTIHGNGAVPDASQKGRFFMVPSGATLALDHLVLQHVLLTAAVMEEPSTVMETLL